MDNMLNFSVSVYGQPEQFNDVLTKARLRIFYKYKNRNSTFISDEFAEELLSSLPYVPVKGIYDNDADDYTDHGNERNEGRIYGIVPENPNVKWEKHLDEDGVEREYACCDVLLFTALYKEANDIVGKAQSMELYEPKIQYHFEVLEGHRYVVFDHGCFLGLQVLGDDVEPCFEGASFFSLQQNITDIIEKIKQYSKGGKTQMPAFTFKIDDEKKCHMLWELLNTEYNEEGGWVVSYGIDRVYDDYALVFDYATGEYERVYYTKDDTTDSIAIKDRYKVYIVDVTEKEKSSLDTLRLLNGDTYECVKDTLTNADANFEALTAANATIAEKDAQISEYDAKIVEMDTTISTLNTEKEGLTADNEKLAADYALQSEANTNLTNQVNELTSYKLNIERQQKESVLSQYIGQLDESVIDAYRAKLDEYALIDLDKDLTYECKQHGVGNYAAASQTNAGLIPSGPQYDGIDAILAKYIK